MTDPKDEIAAELPARTVRLPRARRKSKKTRERQAVEFAAILAIGIALLGGYLYYRGNEYGAMYAGASSGIILVLAVIVRPVWMFIFGLWMKMAEAMGWVMTRVILSVFYFTMMTGTGLALRLLGKRPLDLAWKDGRDSFWIEKTPSESTVERYSKLY